MGAEHGGAGRGFFQRDRRKILKLSTQGLAEQGGPGQVLSTGGSSVSLNSK